MAYDKDRVSGGPNDYAQTSLGRTADVLAKVDYAKMQNIGLAAALNQDRPPRDPAILKVHATFSAVNALADRIDKITSRMLGPVLCGVRESEKVEADGLLHALRERSEMIDARLDEANRHLDRLEAEIGF